MQQHIRHWTEDCEDNTIGFFDFLTGGNKDPLANVKDPRVKRAIQNDPKFKELNKEVQKQAKPFAFLRPAEQIRDLAVSAGRGILKSGVSAGISAANIINPDAPDTLEVNNPIAQKVLGKEPIQSYTKRYQGLTEEAKKKGLGAAAVPLAFLGTGANAALDLTGAGGAEKKTAETFAKDIAKEVTEAGVKNLAKKAGVEVTDDVARSLAHTKDPNIVKNILRGKSDIPKEVPLQVPPPKEIPKPTPPEPQVNPQIEVLDAQIKTQKELIQHAPNDTAKAKLNAKATAMIKEKDGLIQGDLQANKGGIVPEVKLSDKQILGGFHDVRSKFPSDEAFYKQFVLPEAEKSTRSADLAMEIIGRVENDGVPLKEAIDGSIYHDVAGNAAQEAYQSARQELVGIASRNKRPELIKQFDELSKGKSLEERTQILNDALKGYRDKGGALAERVQGPLNSDTMGVSKSAGPSPNPPNPSSLRELTSPQPSSNLTSSSPASLRKNSPTPVTKTPSMVPKSPSKPMDIVEATIPKPKPKQVAKPVTGEVIPPVSTDPFEDINKAITGRGGIASKSAEQRKLLSQERGARFAKGANDTQGSEGYFKQLGALKGEYSKVDFKPMINDIGPQRAEDLFTSARAKINATPDEVYQKIGLHPEGARVNTQRAVRKVLGLEPGLPTKSELKLLSVYNPKLAKGIEAQIPTHRKIFDFAAQLFGNARAAKSTLDFSMGGRQGLFVAGRHPAEWAKANIESVKYAKDAKYFDKEMAAIHGDEWGKLIDEYNPSVLTGGGGHEEQYAATDIVGKVPGVKGAERAYTGGLTTLRKEVLTKAFRAYGNNAEEVKQALGDKGISGLIEAVSTLTGRGGKAGGFVSKHATTLQEALFSPRLWASRLQPLNPAFWKRIGPAGRKEAMESLGSFAAVAGVVLGAAVAAGAEVETDPRSSDFLKIKVGDTRYDILGGFQQNLVFGARQLSGSTKSSTTGAITKFGDKFGGPTRLSSAADLARNKANPVIGAAANILEGKDKAGNKINPATEIGQLFVPINIQQAFDARKNPKDVLKGLPDVVGIGSQTYGVKDTKLTDKQKIQVDKITDPKKKEGYTLFYQTAKNAAGTRSGVSEAINKALEAKDLKGAQKLAKDYNDNYSKAFDDWRSKYKGYTDARLAKEFRSNKINLTPASIKSRLKTIKENTP